MEKLLKYLLCAAGLFWFQYLHAQQLEKLRKPNLIKVGFLGMQGPYGYGTLTAEHSLSPRLSVQGTIGFSPFYSEDIVGLYRFNYHFSAGLRQYLMLRRSSTFQGIYLGVSLSLDRLKLYYKGEGGLAYRTALNAIGVEVGYQFWIRKKSAWMRGFHLLIQVSQSMNSMIGAAIWWSDMCFQHLTMSMFFSA